MRTRFDEIIEYIEKKSPLTEEETRILYKVHLINNDEKLCMKTYKYKLVVRVGEYYANSLLSLYWQVISHRFHHLIHDGKWMD